MASRRILRGGSIVGERGNRLGRRLREVEQSVIATPFNWPGGKSWLAERLLAVMPAADLYHEPFLGSGAVALEAMAQEKYEGYVLSDQEEAVIATWHSLIHDWPELKERLSALWARGEGGRERHYYLIREVFNEPGLAWPRMAALFLYLNAHGYNGLFRRTNGKYNVTFGRQARPESTVLERLSSTRELLLRNNVVLRVADYEESHVSGSAVGFYDPPYWPRQDRGFTGYSGVFGVPEQKALASHFRKQEGWCVQTNGPGARHLYAGFNTFSVNEPTRIGRTADSRGAASTLVIVKKHLHLM